MQEETQEPSETIIDLEQEDLKPKPRPKLAPRGIEMFTVCRQHDETGVSGEGAIFDSMTDFVKVHIQPHPGNKTIITYQDGQQDIYGD